MILELGCTLSKMRNFDEGKSFLERAKRVDSTADVGLIPCMNSSVIVPGDLVQICQLTDTVFKVDA